MTLFEILTVIRTYLLQEGIVIPTRQIYLKNNPRCKHPSYLKLNAPFFAYTSLIIILFILYFSHSYNIIDNKFKILRDYCYYLNFNQ